MKKLLVPVVAVAVLLPLLFAQVPAEKPSAPANSVLEKNAAEDTSNRISVDVTRVNMLFTVSDKKGRFVTDLGQNDFEVFENKKPQKITEFTAETDLPLRLAILIDTSNSIREGLKFQQEAATEFVNDVLRKNQDKAIVVSFDSAAELVADMTDNSETLDNAIRDLRPGGGTALYDAIFYACRDKLVLSDGEDNQSNYTRDQALEMAQKADVVIYTISTNITRIETDGDKVMRYLSGETGGRSFFPFKAEDLQQSFENIANELRHQYNLFYRPEPLRTDGRWHPVTIRVRKRKDLVVSARKGYYAPQL